MKQTNAAWTIPVIALVILIALPAGYLLKTGDHVRILSGHGAWAWPLRSTSIVLNKADGTQAWVKTWGPIVVSSANMPRTLHGQFNLTGNSIIVKEIVQKPGGGVSKTTIRLSQLTIKER